MSVSIYGLYIKNNLINIFRLSLQLFADMLKYLCIK